MPGIRLLLLGTPTVERDGLALKVARRKALALLAYLALARESCRRETLAALLWPDHSESEAHAYLRHTVWVLKEALGEAAVDVDRDSVGLTRRGALWVDVEQFEALLSGRAEHGHPPAEVCPACLAPLAQAVDLYRGDFLTGFSLTDSQTFDEWQLLRAESLRQEAGIALQQLVLCMCAQQQFERAIPYARRWLAMDPLNEEALRLVMSCYAWAGQPVAALRQYRAGVRQLGEELGIQPSAETTALHEAIKRKGNPPVPVMAGGTPLPGSGSAAVGGGVQPVLPTASVPSPRTTPFVGRDAALSKLSAALDQALTGSGQILFIKGEAGAGKTTLARHFARLAEGSNPELLVATGACDPHTGPGDPYLPFREVLRLLTGDVESRGMEGAVSPENAARLVAFAPAVLPVLAELGPDLAGLVAGTGSPAQPGMTADATLGLSTGGGILPQEQAGGVPLTLTSQSRIFGQYAAVIQTLARRRPLVLMLDDLQWADTSSLALLAHLSRRFQEDRVLIICAYRPEDVALATEEDKNSLQGLIGESKRRFGDISIDLDGLKADEARRFVDALVDLEPNRLGETFRQGLYEHTGGQALFTAELLRHLKESGYVILDQHGLWTEARDADWDTLPPRVEGIIEKRINRLAPELRRMLRLASVQGKEFAAEVLASMLGTGEREIIRRLSEELEQEHRLVAALGLSRVADHRLSHYRFRHIAFQHYLYAGISEAERAYLHEDVAVALETLYGNNAPSIAVHLARHFEAAGSLEKAVDYLVLAGNRARQVSANEEAASQLTRALSVMETLPETPERTRRELVALISLGSALIPMKGYADPEVGRVYSRAHALAAPLERVDQLLPALNGLLHFYRVRGDLYVARNLGDRLLAQAQLTGDLSGLAEAHCACGTIALYTGQLALAREHFEGSLASFKEVDRTAHVHFYGDDPAVASMLYGARILWLLGYPDQAARQASAALDQAKELSRISPVSLAQAHVLAAMLHNLRRDEAAAAESADAAFDLSAKHGFEFWLAAASILQGRARARMGQHAWGCAQMERGLVAYRATGVKASWQFGAGLLAETFLEIGETVQGLRVVEEGLAASLEARDWCLPELHRLKGELLLQAGSPAEAQRSLEESLATAREQGAKSLELRALTSLTRLEQVRHTGEEAARCLAEVYGWFQEGLDAPDLREARLVVEGTG